MHCAGVMWRRRAARMLRLEERAVLIVTVCRCPACVIEYGADALPRLAARGPPAGPGAVLVSAICHHIGILVALILLFILLRLLGVV